MKKSIWMVLVAVLSLGLAISACDSGSGGDDNGGDDCTTVCAGKDCGVIGDCTCGSCGGDEACQANICVDANDPCVLACTGIGCGMVDDCDCGGCGDDEFCNNENTCEAGEDPCDATCDGLICGNFEGCECGACGEGETCSEDGLTCDTVCEPVCAADGVPFECGDSGCVDESCGECQAGDQWACVDNMCVCTPDCGDKICGNDGCGGECGECPEDAPNCTPDGGCVAECDFSGVTFDDPIEKVNFLAISPDGLAGHGMDVDDDPATCAPEGNCENGIDNALGGILGQVGQYIDVAAELEGALADGSIVLLFETVGYVSDGTEFPVYFYLGEVTGEQDVCDYQAAKCDYLVDPLSYDIETCEPMINFANSAVNDGVFTAGGPDAIFSLALDVEGIALTITVVRAQIVADVTEADGAPTALDNGLIAGAVPKALIMEAVENMPDDIDLPVSKDLIIGMLEMFIQADIDAGDEFGQGEPDGELESASVGIQFGAIEGAVTGFVVEE